MNILYYVEPWIQFSRPSWKKDYIWWFGDFSKNLLKEYNVKSHFILNESCSLFHQKFDRCSSTYSIIYYEELLKIFSNDKEALYALQKRIFNKKEISDMKSLVLSKIEGFVPDYIFTITPTPFLEELFPNATMIYRDAMYVREPFPDELTSFDTRGLYDQSSIFYQYENIKKLDYGKKEKSFINDFKELFINHNYIYNDLKKEIENLRAKYKFILIFPLQAQEDFNFYIYNNQSNFDFVYETLKKISPEIAVIVTQHPDHYEINQDAIDFLKNKFSNFIYLKVLENYHSPSQMILKYVDGMITLSSGLVYYALMNNKPIFTIYKSHFSPLSEKTSLEEIHNYLSQTQNNSINDQNNKILFFLLTRYNFSYHYMLDPCWLGERLNFLKNNKKNLNNDITILPLIDKPKNILNNLEKYKRPVKFKKDKHLNIFNN